MAITVVVAASVSHGITVVVAASVSHGQVTVLETLKNVSRTMDEYEGTMSLGHSSMALCP
jgi:hypothetical protein